MSQTQTERVHIDEGCGAGSNGKDHKTKREDSVNDDKSNGYRLLRLVDDNGQNVQALVTEEQKGVLVEQGGEGRRWILQKKKKKKKLTREPANGNKNGSWVVEEGGRKWIDGEVKGRWVVEAGKRKWLPNMSQSPAGVQNGINEYLSPRKSETVTLLTKIREPATVDYDYNSNEPEIKNNKPSPSATILSKNLPESIQRDRRQNLSNARNGTAHKDQRIVFENNESLTNSSILCNSDIDGDKRIIRDLNGQKAIIGVNTDDIRDNDFQLTPFRNSYCVRYRKTDNESHRYSVVEELLKQGRWMKVDGRRLLVDGELKGRWIEKKGRRKWIEGEKKGRWVEETGKRRWIEGEKKGKWIEERGEKRWIQNTLGCDQEFIGLGSSDLDEEGWLITSYLASYCFRYRRRLRDLENEYIDFATNGRWIKENRRRRWIERKSKWIGNGKWIDNDNLMLLSENRLETEEGYVNEDSRGVNRQSFCFRYRQRSSDPEVGHESYLSTEEGYDRSSYCPIYSYGTDKPEREVILCETEELCRKESKLDVHNSFFCYKYRHGAGEHENESIMLETEELHRKESKLDCSSFCFRYRHGADELVNLQNDGRLWSERRRRTRIQEGERSGRISIEDGKINQWIQKGGGRRWIEGEQSGRWIDEEKRRRTDGGKTGRWVNEGGGQRWIDGERKGRWMEEVGGRKWIDGEETGRWIDGGGCHRWIDGESTGRWMEEVGGRKWIDGEETGRWIEEGGGRKWIDGESTGRWIEEGGGRRWIDGETTGRWIVEGGCRKSIGRGGIDRWIEEGGGRRWIDDERTEGGGRRWIDGESTDQRTEKEGDERMIFEESRSQWINDERLRMFDGKSTGRWIEEGGVRRWIEGEVKGDCFIEKGQSKCNIGSSSEKIRDEEQLESFCLRYRLGERDVDVLEALSTIKRKGWRIEVGGRRRWIYRGGRGRWVVVEGKRRWIVDDSVDRAIVENQLEPTFKCEAGDTKDNYDAGIDDDTPEDIMEEIADLGNTDKAITDYNEPVPCSEGTSVLQQSEESSFKPEYDTEKTSDTDEPDVKEELLTKKPSVKPDPKTEETERVTEIVSFKPKLEMDETAVSAELVLVKERVNPERETNEVCANTDIDTMKPTDKPELEFANTELVSDEPRGKLEPEHNETSVSTELISDEPSGKLEPESNEASVSTELVSDEPSGKLQPESNETSVSTELVSDEPRGKLEPDPNETSVSTELVSDEPKGKLEPEPNETCADTDKLDVGKISNESQQDENEPEHVQSNNEETKVVTELDTRETGAHPNQDTEDSRLSNKDTDSKDLPDMCPIPETAYPEEVAERVQRSWAVRPNLLKITSVCPTCCREMPHDHLFRQGLDNIREIDVLPGLKVKINLTEVERYFQEERHPS